jgi:hypothetical protein
VDLRGRTSGALLAAGALLCSAAGLASLPVRAASQSDAGTQKLKDPWRTVAPGVQAAAAADLGGDPSWAARVLLIDPQRARLSVQFDPTSPTLAQWRARFPEALALANGSFYSNDGPLGQVRPTCDLVLNGKPVRGAGCRRKDALFFGALPALHAEADAAAGRAPASRGARAQGEAPPATATPACSAKSAGAGLPRFVASDEFRPGEWVEALKSFPALVHACAAACDGPHYCAEHSRTAALAQLRDGKLLLFASQWPAVRREVGRFLAETLGAVEAVNLDGGPEATLALRGESPEDAIGTAGTGLPLVLVLLPRPPAVAPKDKTAAPRSRHAE